MTHFKFSHTAHLGHATILAAPTQFFEKGINDAPSLMQIKVHGEVVLLAPR